MIPFSNYIKSITLGIHQAEQQIKELKFDTEYASYNKKARKRLYSFIEDQYILIDELTPPFSKDPFNKCPFNKIR